MDEPTVTVIERVDIGILVAIPLEASAIVERLRESVVVRAGGRRVSIGRLGRTSVAVMATGTGGDAASQGTRLMVAGHRPARLVVAGLCGGLDPGLSRGDILAADRVGRCPATAPRSNASATPPTATHAWLPVDPWPPGREPSPAPGVVRGPLVTSDVVVDSPAAKQAVHEATGAVAVDMESWWIVEEAGRLGLPVHVVRAVCDTAMEPVPADVASLAVVRSTARMAGAAMRLLWQRPSAAIDMVELRERALAAAEALATRLESMCGN